MSHCLPPAVRRTRSEDPKNISPNEGLVTLPPHSSHPRAVVAGEVGLLAEHRLDPAD